MSAQALTQPIPRKSTTTQWEFWGRLLVVPYLLIFFIFVLYPVGYGLWLARHPVSTAPIFFVKLRNPPDASAPTATYSLLTVLAIA